MSALAGPGSAGAISIDDGFRPRLALRRARGWAFATGCLLLSLVALLVLALLLWHILRSGWHALSLRLLTNPPSSLWPELAGFQTALVGTVWLALLTGLISITVGLGAAIWLQEYAPRNRITRFISLNIANLAGVPSIVYGILGLALFVRWARCGESILAGALTLSLVVLPIIIIVSREALIAVPDSLRQAAFALGATRWQMIWHHVLPAATPGAITGIILAMSRAVGETAPLLMVGALGDVARVPGGYVLPPSIDTFFTWLQRVLFERFTAMPIQIFDWTTIRPQQEFKDLAAAGIIVLLSILLLMNGVAAGIRAWQQRYRIH